MSDLPANFKEVKATEELRKWCLELALKCNLASPNNIVAQAKDFENYVKARHVTSGPL